MRKARLVAATALMLLPALAAPAQTLPPGPGADITVQACTSCHGADTFTSESHDAAGWDAVVTDMIGMGAMVNDAQKKQIVDYLTANYGPAAAPAQGAAAPPPAAAAAAPASATMDWAPIAAALGKSGAVAAGGVYRVGLPRTDLTVKLDGITLKPTFALGSWVAFMPMGSQVMAMGDLVLTEDEVGPVMKKLEESHIDITALHNHLFHASPATFYMHISAMGDGVTIAKAIHDGLALSKTPFPAPSATPAPPPPAIDLDTAAIDKALGAKGSNAAGVYQVAIARAVPITVGGMAMNPPMGASEAINFQPLGGGKAAITGDFMLAANEVNPVLRALRENGIEVTALHSHMLEEQPRMFFMHFWAHDDLAKLLTGLHAALAEVAVAK